MCSTATWRVRDGGAGSRSCAGDSVTLSTRVSPGAVWTVSLTPPPGGSVADLPRGPRRRHEGHTTSHHRWGRRCRCAGPPRRRSRRRRSGDGCQGAPAKSQQPSRPVCAAQAPPAPPSASPRAPPPCRPVAPRPRQRQPAKPRAGAPRRGNTTQPRPEQESVTQDTASVSDPPRCRTRLGVGPTLDRRCSSARPCRCSTAV